MKPVCALTGASGYVGSRIAAALATEFEVAPMGRFPGEGGIAWHLSPSQNITDELKARGVAVLVHSAWDFRHPDPKENWRWNVEGSRKLIDDAQKAGVQQIIFISTISAFPGARSEYGKSKLAVERMILGAGGTVIRPGLVWGDRPGGMFGSLRQQVSKGGVVPVIGSGRYPQYLVHEDDLAAVVQRAANGEFAGRVLTLANPKVWLLRDLILRIAREEGKKVTLVPMPWPLIYSGLKTAETFRLKLGFRSDSVVSLIHQNPNRIKQE